MKILKWSLLVVLVIGLGVSPFLLLTGSPRPLDMDASEVTDANERNQEAEPSEPVAEQSAPVATIPVHKPASMVPLTPDNAAVPLADIVSAPANVVQVRAGQVLAKVNDRAILLADLVPLPPDEQAQVMTEEEYESRLNRAIEMELTFQAAAVRGVNLTPEQTKRVDGVARKHEATFRDYTKQGIAWSSLTVAQVEFERRLTAALMLQQNLVAREAGIAPAPDPMMQSRYEQARSEVLSRLRALGKVSVSTAEL